MRTIEVYLTLMLMLATAFTASLPFRRTSLFGRGSNDLPRLHYEELIARRQIRNGYGSPSAGKEDGQGHSTTAVDEPVGSLKFHDKPTTQMMAPLYGRLELNCVVSGAPPPVVYWLKNGQPIRESPYETEELTNRILESSPMPSRGLASTKSRLILECINEDDEAIYSCVAESHSGEKVVSSTYVHIEGEAPYNETVCSRRDAGLIPASIFMWSGTYIDVEGKDAVLLCRAAGHPAPKVTWIDNEDQPIAPTSRSHQILPTGDLLIRHLDWKTHMGLYKCIVDNGVDKDETTTFVYPVVPDES